MAKAHGFSRDERLRATRDFDRVFEQGRRGRGQALVVCYAPNGLAHSRLGIALRRGWRSAVARNRAKRLIREAFRTRKHELPGGLDLVVIPATNWAEPAPEAIAAELLRLLGRRCEAAP
ncbi:MAG TPA: ribonuclease P protein component [Planctomycetota bacterium]|nr:ribonuclease P protein component [Planctomycetota bacterium]HRR80064.1 ribonuclease P protein component [Planctomycetota bacterium]HRT93047.1 ribonuclease P protein component [Planctomycetota bacterium]